MDLKKSFQILEVRVGASETEVRQAYRDLVSVWHPDRFSSNPRLRKKAEEKLKEANAAYETLKSFFHQGGRNDPREEERAESHGRKKSADRMAENGGEVSKTERFVETGTEVALRLWAHLAGKMGQIFSDSGKKK